MDQAVLQAEARLFQLISLSSGKNHNTKFDIVVGRDLSLS
jgi:hypothetical protein